MARKVMFDVPSSTPDDMRRRRSSINAIKEMHESEDGKRFIRDSLALKPISKERRRKELEKMRKSFNFDEAAVANLRSCLAVKRHHGDIEEVKWKEDKELVQTFEITKIRASCWDDCFFTEEELAEFKYQAFMEECGLDPSEFE